MLGQGGTLVSSQAKVVSAGMGNGNLWSNKKVIFSFIFRSMSTPSSITSLPLTDQSVRQRVSEMATLQPLAFASDELAAKHAVSIILQRLEKDPATVLCVYVHPSSLDLPPRL